MDDSPFDALTRQIHSQMTRRRSLQLLPGIGLLLGTGIALDADAKKRKKRKKKPKGTSCQEGQTVCGGVCISSTQCCTNAECSGGKTCQSQTCTCPANRPICPLVSPDTCCAPQPGVNPSGISCDVRNGRNVCLCTIRASDACRAGCPEDRLIAVDCATFDLTDLGDFCVESGCEPPL